MYGPRAFLPDSRKKKYLGYTLGPLLCKGGGQNRLTVHFKKILSQYGDQVRVKGLPGKPKALQNTEHKWTRSNGFPGAGERASRPLAESGYYHSGDSGAHQMSLRGFP